MQIKPSASIRQNYNEIAALCKSTGEPVYLTTNGEGGEYGWLVQWLAPIIVFLLGGMK